VSGEAGWTGACVYREGNVISDYSERIAYSKGTKEGVGSVLMIGQLGL
jgi:hypothetical protein